jgi:tRNA threonylcarbamoyl adenosine modification protein YeaZ
MSWLAFDTATDRASVALGTGGAAIERHADGARGHARQLLPMIDELLQEAGRLLTDLDGVIVADGPGSFTGLRVGASVAKALHDAAGLSLFTAPSLLGCALAGSDLGQPVLVTSNALRGDVFAAVYSFEDGAVQTLHAPSVVRQADAALLCGGAAELEVMPADARRLIQLVGWTDGLALIENVAAWAPTYGRPAEAQAQWERIHGRALAHPPSLAG